MVCYNCDHPNEAALAGEAQEGAASQACASAVTGRATSPWNAQTPPTAGPEAAAPSVAGWCKVELLTIHRFSQSRRRPPLDKRTYKHFYIQNTIKTLSQMGINPQ